MKKSWIKKKTNKLYVKSLTKNYWVKLFVVDQCVARFAENLSKLFPHISLATISKASTQCTLFSSRFITILGVIQT